MFYLRFEVHFLFALGNERTLVTCKPRVKRFSKMYTRPVPFHIPLQTKYCEILFIRGDPIFVFFVDGLAHEFKIPRIMNTISNIIVTIVLNYFQSLGVLL